MKSRGFTLIELLVVVIVISILASITTLAYIGYQNQATTRQAESYANIIAAAAEKYYLKNGEYPTAPADGESVGVTSALDIPANSFEGGKWRIRSCIAKPGSCYPASYLSSSDGSSSIFYVTKANNAAGGAFGCTFDSVDTNTAFAVVYHELDKASGTVKVLKSNRGGSAITGC